VAFLGFWFALVRAIWTGMSGYKPHG
jgi:hypothetical protein